MIANIAAAPNRRPRFLLSASFPFDYFFCAPHASPAAVGEPRGSALGCGTALRGSSAPGCPFQAIACASEGYVGTRPQWTSSVPAAIRFAVLTWTRLPPDSDGCALRRLRWNL